MKSAYSNRLGPHARQRFGDAATFANYCLLISAHLISIYPVLTSFLSVSPLCRRLRPQNGGFLLLCRAEGD